MKLVLLTAFALLLAATPFASADDALPGCVRPIDWPDFGVGWCFDGPGCIGTLEVTTKRGTTYVCV